MDRCRCEDYHEAVKKIRFYTLGTHRPDIIDNFDGTGYRVQWVRRGVDAVPKAFKIYPSEELPQNQVSKDCWRLTQMWCPYMSQVKKDKNLIDMGETT